MIYKTLNSSHLLCRHWLCIYLLSIFYKIVIKIIYIFFNDWGSFSEELFVVGMNHFRPSAPFVDDWELLLRKKEELQCPCDPLWFFLLFHPFRKVNRILSNNLKRRHSNFRKTFSNFNFGFRWTAWRYLQKLFDELVICFYLFK